MERLKIDDQFNLFNKFSLRFLFLYFLFYIYPYGFEYIYEFNPDAFSFWEGITIWFGETFIGWDVYENMLNKGFDSKYDFSRFLLIAVQSLLFSVLWMYLDFKFKLKYDFTLRKFLRTILRYHVGFTLIMYGLAKVFMTQFGNMDIEKLEVPIGNSSGMGFLWTFMSYSKFYTMITGWVEVIGGIFLLFRRTTFIGSFILFIVMINVVIIDIGFDVSVKMFAIHLLLMVIVLLSKHLKRMYNFFMNYEVPTASIREESLFPKTQIKKGMSYVKVLLLICFSISCYFFTNRALGFYPENTTPSLTGFYEVENQKVNDESISLSKGKEWKSFLINGTSWQLGFMNLKKGDNENYRYSFKADTIKRTIDFYAEGDSLNPYKFTYNKISGEELVLKGMFEGDTLWLKTRVKKLEDYRLMNQIKWVRDLD